MKKTVVFGMCFLLAVCSLSSVSASESDIISGDGSFDNPYVLKDDNNEVGEFINKNYDEKNSELKGRSTQIFPASLKADTSKTISNPGSYWYRTGGGGSTATNGSLVYTLIDYTNWE